MQQLCPIPHLARSALVVPLSLTREQAEAIHLLADVVQACANRLEAESRTGYSQVANDLSIGLANLKAHLLT